MTTTAINDLAALEAARAAAFAAWQAAPEKGRGARAEKARLEAELAAANRAVAAAKKAAAAPAADVSAAVDAALAARAAREKTAGKEDAVRRAAALWSAAQEWPRCGQQWPATPAEERAETLMRANLALAQSWGYNPE